MSRESKETGTRVQMDKAITKEQGIGRMHAGVSVGATALTDADIGAKLVDEGSAGGASGSESRRGDHGGRRPSMVKGAAILGVAVILGKLLGTLQKIPLQNLAGDRVFGIYNAVYPFYQLLLAAATAGVPVAVSIMVAEQAAVGGRRAVYRTLQVSTLLLAVAGVAGFGLMWAGADPIARWIGDPAASRAIRASALALWVVPVMAALRGYYQGLGRMLPTAVSQLAEQTVRVAAMLSLLVTGLALDWSDGMLAAGATAGSAAGGMAGLAVLTWLWAREQRKVDDRRALAAEEGAIEKRGGRRIARRLIGLAVPVTLGALALPVLGVVDSLSVPPLLTAGGMSGAEAMAQFGLYSRGQPLVQLVVMIAGAVGGALVHGLVSARAQGDEAAARAQAALAMKGAWWIGSGAACGLVLLAPAMNRMLYADEAATTTFALVGLGAVAGTVSAIAAAVLQGVGVVRAPALYMLAAAALKAALNAAIVPAYGIAGAAGAGLAALGAAALLSAAAVRRACAARMPARSLAGLVLALAVMAAALTVLERAAYPALLEWLPPRAAATALALGGTGLGAALFLAAGLRFGGVSARDVRALPGGAKLAARLRRLQLLPPGD
ncbi:oligosaccharide flippase family protein [Paenibacillus aurantiacus]|uniref:Oligosaccharide flippase family protein n=1 Tax=Paenibacillus aurantiacus TaxID=1936118 RepID=A0ABV5KJ17_9BACL